MQQEQNKRLAAHQEHTLLQPANPPAPSPRRWGLQVALPGAVGERKVLVPGGGVKNRRVWGQRTRPVAKHGMAITGPLLAAPRVIKAKSARGAISTSQTTSPDVARSQDVGAPTDTHLRSQLLQTKHSQRWSLHPGPRSQELSRPFSRRHCLVFEQMLPSPCPPRS